MWKKIKHWWAERKERKAQKAEAELRQFEATLSYMCGGPNYVRTNIYQVPHVICSTYFNQDKEWVVVDFSRYSEGLAHFMIFTKDKQTEYDPDAQEEGGSISAYLKNATICMKHYMDGDSGWCLEF